MAAYSIEYRGPDRRQFYVSADDHAGGVAVRILGPAREPLGEGWLGPNWGRGDTARWASQPRAWTRVLRERGQEILRSCGVSFDKPLVTTADRVRALFENDARLSPTEVARALNLPISRASAYCGVLASRGHLRRVAPGIYAGPEPHEVS